MTAAKGSGFTALLALIIAAGAQAAGAQPRAAPKKIQFEEDHSLPIVYLDIVSDAGAAQDPPGKLGLANIASRMLLRGTQRRSKTEFFRQVELLGGQIRVDGHQQEGMEFHAEVLSENLDRFLDLLEETLVKPKITAEELHKLKKETIGRILEQKGDDRALAGLHFLRFFYGSHPYGNPVMGTQKGVKAITHKDVLDHYSRHFGGGTLSLFGSGDASEEKIERWFSKLVAKLTALHPEAAPVEPLQKPVIPSGRRTLIVDKPKTTQTQILIGGTGMRPEDPRFYAVQLANHSFGGDSFQARMMVEIRVKRGWTYGASNHFRFGALPRHFAMHLFPKTDDTPPAIALAVQLFEDFVKSGLTEEEFEFARDSLINNAPFNYDTPKKRLSNAINEHFWNFPQGFFRDFSKNIAAVSYRDIAPAVKTIFQPGDLTLVVVGDAAKLKGELQKLPGFGKPAVRGYLVEE